MPATLKTFLGLQWSEDITLLVCLGFFPPPSLPCCHMGWIDRPFPLRALFHFQILQLLLVPFPPQLAGSP